MNLQQSQLCYMNSENINLIRTPKCPRISIEQNHKLFCPKSRTISLRFDDFPKLTTKLKRSSEACFFDIHIRFGVVGQFRGHKCDQATRLIKNLAREPKHELFCQKLSKFSRKKNDNISEKLLGTRNFTEL